jgi:serine/threonine protein kinase
LETRRHSALFSAAWKTFQSRGRTYLTTDLGAGGASGAGRFAIAQVVGQRYEVASVFAVGESSVLLEGRDISTYQRVLIKVMRTDAIAAGFAEDDRHGNSPREVRDQVRRARHHLQTERRLLVRLRNMGCAAVVHPNDYVFETNPLVAELLAEGDPLANAEPYLILEQVSGSSLEDLLLVRYPGGLDEKQAAELLLPVVEALTMLHEPWHHESGRVWNCVYEDLKPANILVDKLARATLVDFGGCQVVVDGVPVLEGACTPGYAPPECAQPGRVLLPCADVYTIGSTLYHILTGIDPRASIERKPAKSAEPFDLAQLERKCSPRMRDIVAGCVASRPSDRFADARQVAQALQSTRSP